MELIIDLETYRSELSPEQREYRESGIKAPKGYKDKDKITEFIKKKGEKLYQRDALDPMYGKIIAIGYMITDIDEIIVKPTVIIDKDEQALLIEFYKALGEIDEPSGVCYPITFNGTDFDIPFLNFRTMTHSITSHYRLQVLPENDIKHLLAQKFVKTPEHTLEEYAMHFGIPIYKGVTGKDIARLWEEQQLESIIEHCLSDVKTTFKLWQISRFYHISHKRSF